VAKNTLYVIFGQLPTIKATEVINLKILSLIFFINSTYFFLTKLLYKEENKSTIYSLEILEIGFEIILIL
jgi:hypothetical protein